MTEAQAWELIAAVASVRFALGLIFGSIVILGSIWICERIGARRIAVARKL